MKLNMNFLSISNFGKKKNQMKVLAINEIVNMRSLFPQKLQFCVF